MKKVGKIKTIYRAFFNPKGIDKEEWQKRMEICDTCIFNSKNAELTGFSSLRAKLIEKPFCTQCGCQIYEKTSSETEACGLESQKQYPKWNRILVETTNRRDMNLVNKTIDFANVTLDNGDFVIDVGEVNRRNTKTILVGLLSDTAEQGFKINRVASSCSACLKAKAQRVSEAEYNLYLDVNWARLSGHFYKYALIEYEINGENHKAKVIVKGKIS